MKLKKLPADCIAGLRLKELTLHGIGSYLLPARLEIKPLTILCGPNGSGADGYVQRSGRLPEFLAPPRFLDWFLAQHPALLRSNFCGATS